MYKQREQIYYQSATLLDAGLPVTRSLETVADGQAGRYKKAVDQLLDEVGGGSQLNIAMLNNRRVFGDFDIKMVEAAEQSGNLSDTFKMLAKWYSYHVRLLRKLLGGMVFPVLILHLAVFLGPLSSFFMGNMTSEYYLNSRLVLLGYLWGGGLGIYLLVKIIPKRGTIRLTFDTALQVIPLLGKALRNMAFGRFCRSFNMLYKSGVPIVTAAELAVDMTGNALISKLLAGTVDSVQAGRPMYKGFSKQLIPFELIASWESGEESGSLDFTSEHMAKTYEDLAERNFNELIFWIPKIFYGCVMIYIIYQIAKGFGAVYGAAVGM